MIRAGMALFAVAVLVGLPAHAHAQLKKSDSVVKVTATADKPDADGKQKVTVTIAIDKTYHIYANPVGLDILAGSETIVEVSAKTKPEDVKIEYPKGKLQIDATVGNYMIYEDKAVITANVRRAKGDIGPLKVTVKLGACTNENCLLPAAVDIEVP